MKLCHYFVTCEYSFLSDLPEMSAECLIWRVHGGVLTLSVADTQEVNIIVTVCDTPKHLLDPFRALEIEISIKGDFSESSANSKPGSFMM